MSFNDIPDFRKALERLSREYPKLIPAGAYSILWVIVGWPNGCFIGEQAIARQAGLALSTYNTYLRRLTKLGFIDREQTHGRQGLRQCYRVKVDNITNYPCLSPVVGRDNSVPSINSELVPITDTPIASNLLYAYKDYKDYKDDKDDKDDTTVFNADRWGVIIKGVPRELRSKVRPGDNLELRLNKLATLKVADEAICASLTRHNWQGVTTPGAIVKRLLEELIGLTEDHLNKLADQRIDQDTWRKELAEERRNACDDPTPWAELARQAIKDNRS